MNKSVAPWSGTKGLHKEKIADKIANTPERSEKAKKKGLRKNMVKMAEEHKKLHPERRQKIDLQAAFKHMREHQR